ncbi:hypothetical protein C0Z23_21990 [Salmonella enterica]|nr:hypothetical protein [Salmonella enterica]
MSQITGVFLYFLFSGIASVPFGLEKINYSCRHLEQYGNRYFYFFYTLSIFPLYFMVLSSLLATIFITGISFLYITSGYAFFITFIIIPVIVFLAIIGVIR